MILWLMDPIGKTMLPERRNQSGLLNLKRKKVTLIMEKRRKRRVGLVVENKKELLKNCSLAAVEIKRGKIGRIVTVIGLKRKGNAKGPRKWDGSEDEFKPESDAEKPEEAAAEEEESEEGEEEEEVNSEDMSDSQDEKEDKSKKKKEVK